MTQPTTAKRPAHERGTADHGWLQARFSFSFGDYQDPAHMGFRSLRVINNDTIQPGGGFPRHPHRDMEIFTYVIEGSLEHQDSMGNGAVIEPGNLQYMSAGSGVFHSEFNPSPDAVTTLYQVWIEPHESGGEPRYAEKPLRDHVVPNRPILLFSADGREGSTAIRQTADIYYLEMDAGAETEIPASAEAPHAWVQMISGDVEILDNSLSECDGLAIKDAGDPVAVRAGEAAAMLVFRLA